MEHTIEQIQNDIMNRMQQFDFGDRVTILRELENFCGQQKIESIWKKKNGLPFRELPDTKSAVIWKSAG